MARERRPTDAEAATLYGTEDSATGLVFPNVTVNNWGPARTNADTQIIEVAANTNNLRPYLVEDDTPGSVGDAIETGIGVRPGRFTINGTTLAYAGSATAVTGLSSDDTYYVWIYNNSSTATVASATDATGWPTYEHIKLAEVVKSNGVLTITDLRGGETFQKGIPSSFILVTPKIADASEDHNYIVSPGELAADRTVSLPVLSGNDTFVFLAASQTLTNKTLTTPTITDFTNATHDHEDAAGGGQLATAAIADDAVTAAKLNADTAGDGIQQISGALAVDVSEFAGDGLEDDGSENLRIALDGTTLALSASGVKVADSAGLSGSQLAAATSGTLGAVLQATVSADLTEDSGAIGGTNDGDLPDLTASQAAVTENAGAIGGTNDGDHPDYGTAPAALTEDSGAIGGTNDGDLPDLSSPDASGNAAAIREVAAKANEIAADVTNLIAGVRENATGINGTVADLAAVTAAVREVAADLNALKGLLRTSGVLASS